MDLIDASLYVMYICIIIPIILVIVFPIVQMVNNPEGLKGTLLGLGSIFLIWLICYLTSGNETEIYMAKHGISITPSISQIVGGSLVCLYSLFIISVLGIIYSEVSKIFK